MNHHVAEIFGLVKYDLAVAIGPAASVSRQHLKPERGSF
jgi:hypothetical protein